MRVLICLFLLCHAAFAYDPAPVPGRRGMVVSAQHLATDVGIDVLKQGGNAVDAAVAVGYALAVTYPAAGNLGGGGFMTVRMADGTSGFLDFRERAPLAATPGMFLDGAGHVVPGRSTDSWLAVGVPGTPAGLEAARVLWGTRPRGDLLAPAIRLARDGFTIRAADAAMFRLAAARLATDRAAAAIFFREDRAPEVGDRLIQTDLAATLEGLAVSGPNAFYRGPIAEAIVAASARGGGILQAADFERYSVRQLPPLMCDYRGYQVISAPPPSSGGVVLCEMLNILEGFDLRALGFHSAASLHVMAEAMRRAFYDRNQRLGDPDFVDNPISRLLDKRYAAVIRSRIEPQRATPSVDVGAQSTEGSDTTHYVVVDDAGNAVSVTYTLNGWFGVKKVAPGTGVLLNNEMDDFTAKPGAANQFGLVQGEANAVAPGKTPLSSMSPTIIARDGHTVMVVGSPGGPRIISAVLNAIVNVIDYRLTVQEAVNAPRIHHQWLPDTIFAEQNAVNPDTRALLESWGYTITEQGPWGIVEAILVGGPRLGAASSAGSSQSLVLAGPTESGAVLFGAHDPRSESGSAAGY